jgi:polyhydroxybutyrate depolymerase
MMSYRFACTRPDLVGGVMSLAGVLVLPACPNASGVRILQIHGLDDSVIPVQGGGGGERFNGEPFRTVQQTADALRAGGAVVDTVLLPGSSHGIGSLDDTLRATQGVSVATRLAQFVQGF